MAVAFVLSGVAAARRTVACTVACAAFRAWAGLDRQSGSYPARVEILFTTLLVLAAVAILWFTFYVVYRLYADRG